MNLIAEMRNAVQRYARNIADDSKVPEGLVTDLVLIAETHAAESVEQAIAASSRAPATRKPRTRPGGAE